MNIIKFIILDKNGASIPNPIWVNYSNFFHKNNRLGYYNMKDDLASYRATLIKNNMELIGISFEHEKDITMFVLKFS